MCFLFDESESDYQGLPWSNDDIERRETLGPYPRRTTMMWPRPFPSPAEIESFRTANAEPDPQCSDNARSISNSANESTNVSRQTKWLHPLIPKPLFKLGRRHDSVDRAASLAGRSRSTSVSMPTRLKGPFITKDSLQDGLNNLPNSQTEEKSPLPCASHGRHRSIRRHMSRWRKAVQEYNTDNDVQPVTTPFSGPVELEAIRPRCKESTEVPFSGNASSGPSTRSFIDTLQSPQAVKTLPRRGSISEFNQIRGQLGTCIRSTGDLFGIAGYPSQMGRSIECSGPENIRPGQEDNYDRYYQFLAQSRKSKAKSKDMAESTLSDGDSKSHDSKQNASSKGDSVARKNSEDSCLGARKGFVLEQPNERPAVASKDQPEETHVYVPEASTETDELWIDTKKVAIEAVSRLERAVPYSMRVIEDDQELPHLQNIASGARQE